MDSETIRRIEEHKGYLSRAKFVLMCVHRQLDEEERQQKKKVTAAEEAALPAK